MDSNRFYKRSFYQDTMNTAQKIAKESIISFTGIVYGSLNRYVYSALLARWVGPEYLGMYSKIEVISLHGRGV